jgi:glutamine synthetase
MDNKEINSSEPLYGEHSFIIEYIWTGGKDEFRSKVRHIKSNKKILKLDVVPNWNFDGSSTNQALTEDSEVIIKPIQLYYDKKDNKYYTLCETYKIYNNNLVPLENNYRYKYTELVKKYGDKIQSMDFWFGFEQEFFIFDQITNTYLGNNKDIPKQGPYYCNVETINTPYNSSKMNHHPRKYTEIIFNKCLDLDIGVTGWNLEVAPAQTEIQIFGKNIKACDDLMMLRYIAHRFLAEYSLSPDFHPKPYGKDWNGSGLHTNVSTLETRENNGFEYIQKYMEKFNKNHEEHIKDYGEENKLRLTGKHETSSIDKFTYGVGTRNTSVRIPYDTFINKKGYFEDRRPAGWANPYKVVCRIIDSIME